VLLGVVVSLVSAEPILITVELDACLLAIINLVVMPTIHALLAQAAVANLASVVSVRTVSVPSTKSFALSLIIWSTDCSPDLCVASCDQKSYCDPGFGSSGYAEVENCPLNVCCSP